MAVEVGEKRPTRGLHYLTAASDALFQERERAKAAEEPWPETLSQCHTAIREELRRREEASGGERVL
jgi:hypothetical protein